jgi:hypothetical protein
MNKWTTGDKAIFVVCSLFIVGSLSYLWAVEGFGVGKFSGIDFIVASGDVDALHGYTSVGGPENWYLKYLDTADVLEAYVGVSTSKLSIKTTTSGTTGEYFSHAASNTDAGNALRVFAGAVDVGTLALTLDTCVGYGTTTEPDVCAGSGAPTSTDCDAVGELGSVYFRSDDNTECDDSGSATIYVCRDQDGTPTYGWDPDCPVTGSSGVKEYFSAYDTTGGVDVDTAPATVVFDTVLKNSNGSVFTLSSGELTINKTGTYMITVDCSCINTKE